MGLILYINDSSSLKPFKYEQTLNLFKHFDRGKGKANFQFDNKIIVDIFM